MAHIGSAHDARPLFGYEKGESIAAHEGELSVQPAVQDGARDALVGYLYQLVGVAGLRALALNFQSNNEELHCELINWIRQGVLLHEIFGQDAAVSLGVGGTVAIQFKYSRSASGGLIQRSDFHEILNAFDRCRRDFLTSDAITRFVLITNRQLHGDVRTLYEARNAPQPLSGLLPHGNSKLAQTLDEVYGSREQASQPWHDIHRNLIICEDIPFASWDHSLRCYARSHGLNDAEFVTALDRLIGNLLRTTRQGAVDVSHGWLNEQLVGASDARPLSLDALDSARLIAGERVNQFVQRITGAPSNALVRRRYIQQLDAEIRQNGVVFLIGGGGCGKSVLAAHYLLSQVRQSFVYALRASALEDRWLGRAVSACRSAARAYDLPCDSDPDVLSRVLRANPEGEPPLLIIDVDGLDEWTTQHRHVLDGLIEMIQGLGSDRPTAACLILTARAASEDIERARRALVREWLPFVPANLLSQEPGIVLVGDFDSVELSDAVARMPQNNDVKHRLQAALSLHGFRRDLATLEEEMMEEPADGLVCAEILASLHHPALWGAFIRLPAEAQHQALEGVDGGRGALADAFLDRFCEKVQARMRNLPMGLDRLDNSMRQIGRHFPGNPAVGDRNRHWIEPLTGPLNLSEARFLYEEAISYGLIRENEPGRWRWRHTFIGDHLRQDGGSR